VRGSAVALGAAAAVLMAGGCGETSKPAPQPHSAKATRHYAFGTNADQRRALSLGFDVLDITGSSSDPARTKAIVDALPPGVQALIWVGNLDNTSCTEPGYTTAQYRELVEALASNRKVYGYYLADEPHPQACPRAAADIRARADFLHAHSRFQKAFIVVQDGAGICGSDLGCEFEALQPRNTHVDLVGVDPYPCHYSGGRAAVPCDYGLIRERVAAATNHGVPQSAIVPLFQEFGQEERVGGSVYYRTPTPNELRRILATWRDLIPSPVLDAAYTFGTQCSKTCPSPQALANHPELQSVVRAYNR
jgi:hypothetical protein